MPQPAQQAPRRATRGRAPEAPPVDPTAVRRAYARERARRRARTERTRSRKRAALRFWTTLLVLLTAVAVLSLTIWNEVVDLFGPLSPFG